MKGFESDDSKRQDKGHFQFFERAQPMLDDLLEGGYCKLDNGDIRMYLMYTPNSFDEPDEIFIGVGSIEGDPKDNEQYVFYFSQEKKERLSSRGKGPFYCQLDNGKKAEWTRKISVEEYGYIGSGVKIEAAPFGFVARSNDAQPVVVVDSFTVNMFWALKNGAPVEVAPAGLPQPGYRGIIYDFCGCGIRFGGERSSGYMITLSDGENVCVHALALHHVACHRNKLNDVEKKIIDRLPDASSIPLDMDSLSNFLSKDYFLERFVQQESKVELNKVEFSIQVSESGLIMDGNRVEGSLAKGQIIASGTDTDKAIGIIGVFSPNVKFDATVNGIKRCGLSKGDIFEWFDEVEFGL